MTTITLLGSARRACTGPTRRETLKVGALSLLGGFFNTPSLLALESSANRPTRPARAKSVVLLYLQGGPPTQDMFDLKPAAPNGVRGEFKPIATSAPGVESLRAAPADGPLDAQVGGRSQRVPQRGLSQEPADVYGLRREPAGRGVPRQRPAEHGVGLRLLGTRPAEGAADLCLSSLSAGLGRSAKKSRAPWRISRPPLRPVLHRMHRVRRPPAG